MSAAILIYYGFARVAFLKILAYRLRYFTGILTYFINVSVYYFIWKAVYSGSTSLAGYDLPQMVTYVGVGWMTRSFYFNNVDRDMAAEVSEGKISINLIKPVDTQLMYIAQTAGEACFRAVDVHAPDQRSCCSPCTRYVPPRPPARQPAYAVQLFSVSAYFRLDELPGRDPRAPYPVDPRRDPREVFRRGVPVGVAGAADVLP